MEKPTREYVDIVLYTVPLRICGVYSPGSPQVMYYSDMSGHPGDPEEFELCAVWAGGVDIMDLVEPLLGEIEEEVLKTLDR